MRGAHLLAPEHPDDGGVGGPAQVELAQDGLDAAGQSLLHPMDLEVLAELACTRASKAACCLSMLEPVVSHIDSEIEGGVRVELRLPFCLLDALLACFASLGPTLPSLLAGPLGGLAHGRQTPASTCPLSPPPPPLSLSLPLSSSPPSLCSFLLTESGLGFTVTVHTVTRCDFSPDCALPPGAEPGPLGEQATHGCSASKRMYSATLTPNQIPNPLLPIFVAVNDYDYHEGRNHSTPEDEQGRKGKGITSIGRSTL
eukprot:scaffold160126_cov31-Tisochrysis_lutea.AAC.4